MLANDLAEHIGATLYVPESCRDKMPLIKKVNTLEAAKNEELSFLSNPDYEKYLHKSLASAIIVGKRYDDLPKVQLIHENPYLAFAKAAQIFYEPPKGPAGISELAFIASDAEVAEDVTVYPHAFISSNAKIGESSIIYPGVFIGDGVEIGARCTLHAGVVIYHHCKVGNDCIIHANSVIGADGFGFATGKDEVVKIPQAGIVEIGNGVEIGASTTIDRAALGVTKIGDGCKLDNQVQIAHNVILGKRCMLSAFSGVSGSAKLGDGVVLGGNTGVTGHVEVASGIRVGGNAGVTKTLKEPGDYLGFPAIPAKKWRKQQAYLRRLDLLEKRIKQLEG